MSETSLQQSCFEIGLLKHDMISFTKEIRKDHKKMVIDSYSIATWKKK